MYIDFAINDTEMVEVEAREAIRKVIDLNIVNSITVPYYYGKLIKPFLFNGLDFACFIDYPLGLSDKKTRCTAVEQAVKLGFNTVDVAMPQNLAANRKYDKIRDDIRMITNIKISEPSVTIRYILEYRTFDHNCLKKICEIFDDFGIRYVFPSTNFFLDNLADNILASVFLHQNSKDLKVIASGNIWQEKHFETMKRANIFGFRTNSINALINYSRYNYGNKTS